MQEPLRAGDRVIIDPRDVLNLHGRRGTVLRVRAGAPHGKWVYRVLVDGFKAGDHIDLCASDVQAIDLVTEIGELGSRDERG